jgi:signal transduction histidine kinase
LAIYRILQQSLENSLTHGGPRTRVLVRFSWHPTGLEVIVDDDGARSAARREGLDPDDVARQRGASPDDELAALTQPAIGRGITEMRERAELYGGLFNATVHPGVGFTVTAIFPARHEQNGTDGVK